MTETSPTPSPAQPIPPEALTPGAGGTRTSARYVVPLAAATFGVYLALLTPVMVSLAFKLQHITATTAEATQALGLVTGVGALFALFTNPLVGRLSDRTTSRFGMRRPWIVGGTAVALGAFFLIGAATDVWMVLLGWCMVQAGLNGTLAAVNATIPDQVPVSGRGKVSGVIGLMSPVGILGGNFLISRLDADLTRFVVPGIIGTVLAVVFAVLLRDRRLTEPPQHRYSVKEFLGSFVFNPRTHPDFGWTWLTKFLVMFGYGGVATFLPFFLTDKFGLDEADAITTVLLCNFASLGAMAVSGPLGGILSDRIGKRRPFVTAAGVIIVVGLVVTALAPTTTFVIVGQAIVGLGAGSFMSVDLALATQVLPDPRDTAKDLGVLNIASTLPSSLAPAVAPAIIAIGSATAIGGYATFYLVGAIFCLLGAVLVYKIKGVS